MKSGDETTGHSPPGLAQEIPHDPPVALGVVHLEEACPQVLTGSEIREVVSRVRMELDHSLALAASVHGDVLHDRRPVDQLADIGTRPVGTRDDLQSPRGREIGKVVIGRFLLHRRADAEDRRAATSRVGHHLLIVHRDGDVRRDLRRAVDLATGRNAVGRIEERDRRKEPGLPLEPTTDHQHALLERAVVVRPGHRQSDGDAVPVLTRFETFGQHAADGRDVGTEIDELELHVPVPCRRVRVVGREGGHVDDLVQPNAHVSAPLISSTPRQHSRLAMCITNSAVISILSASVGSGVQCLVFSQCPSANWCSQNHSPIRSVQSR